MGRYRKRPIEIEALQMAGGNTVEIARWITAGGGTFRAITNAQDATKDLLIIHTLEGDMVAADGDWIIKGIAGEFYPCKPDIFAATYEECDTPS